MLNHVPQRICKCFTACMTNVYLQAMSTGSTPQMYCNILAKFQHQNIFSKCLDVTKT